ncbi:MAG: sigma-54-dependent Fis family transcriptional regulator [Betaproteobacteria bacterium HGW-Betaproteobacteria-11]|nr:MAG: sigma-54-dependent Fis family transcriptional regulator [Betaproteobacteria bacterium HGW-Betaproteobacteria-11]
MGAIEIATARGAGDAMRIARRCLLDSGVVPDGLVSARIARSWQRSLAAGLDPHQNRPLMQALSAPELSQARESQQQLIDHARPAMAYLHSQIRDSGSIIVLADPAGLLLELCGDADFGNKAARVHLAPGASWHEAQRGTNAVGTALAERAPVVVSGAEHFFVSNGFLTCAAAPITDSCGRLLGVLDISGDYRSSHPHTFGLVCTAVQMVENRLFTSRHGNDLRVRFHPLAEGIGTLAEGMVALTGEGGLLGINSMGRSLLGLTAADLSSARLDSLFPVEIETLLDWGRRHTDEPLSICRHDGSPLFMRVDMPRSVSLPRAATPISVPRDALAGLDTGDERVRVSIDKARRVLAKSIPLLIMGESGVGKELFAKAVHQSGPRRQGPFVAVNCAALPENLIEAELFGYTGGAFTGARREGRPGLLREANGGSLFLDEIGDMPLALQGRLLRVLQERVVQPLGGGRPVPVDFHLICATHHHLKDVVSAGRFRDDLYYRINGLALTLPPLRERSDVHRLIAMLLAEIEPGHALGLAPEVTKAFVGHAWPGNLRQLANALRTAAALLAEREQRIGWEHLPEDLVAELRLGSTGDARPAAPESLQALAEQTIAATLAATHGNVAAASRRLGISRTTLYRRLGQLGKR